MNKHLDNVIMTTDRMLEARSPFIQLPLASGNGFLYVTVDQIKSITDNEPETDCFVRYGTGHCERVSLTAEQVHELILKVLYKQL
jgi:hypothetical protein